MTAIIIISVFSVVICIGCMIYSEWKYKKDVREFMDYVDKVHKLIEEEENAETIQTERMEFSGSDSGKEEKTER